MPSSCHNLRGHPVKRAYLSERQRVYTTLRTSEIGKLNSKVQGEENVCSFQVSVDYRRLMCVQVVETFQHTPRGFPQEVTLQGAKIADVSSQSSAGHIFHVYVQLPVDAVAAQTSHNIPVLQILADVQFSLELLGILLVLLATDTRNLNGEDLAVFLLPRKMYGAVTAAANLVAPFPPEVLLARWRFLFPKG